MIKWRYYYKKDGEIIISDEPPMNLGVGITKLTIAALSCGLGNQKSITKIRDFFVEKNCLVRVPIFVNRQGIEIEAQSKDYVLYGFGTHIANGLSPTQGAEVIISSILDGFDIMPITGGTGFTEHTPYVFEYVLQHPEFFIGKPKVRLFGFSDNSISIILKDFVQFIAYDFAHAITERDFKKKSTPNDAKFLEIIAKTNDFLPERTAIPCNQLAHTLCEQSLPDDFICYPFVFYFFNNFAQSIFPFVPSKDEKYSLMLDKVIYYYSPFEAYRYCESFRTFLANLKKQDLPLPFAIEIGDAIPHDFFELPHENGLLLYPAQVREKYGDIRYQEFKTKIASYFSRNTENFSDEAAEELIKTRIHPFYQEYLKEITKIADTFQIPVFVGGSKRFGHSDHKSIQPSASINKAELKQDGDGQKYLTIQSEVIAANPTITEESIQRLAQHKGQIKGLAYETILNTGVIHKTFKLKVSPVNAEASQYPIRNIKTAELQNIFSVRQTDQDRVRLCVTEPIFMRTKHEFLTYLESSLLSGKIANSQMVTEHCAIDKTPIIFAVAYNDRKDDKAFQRGYKGILYITEEFCQKHKIITPIYISNTPFENLRQSQTSNIVFDPRLNQTFTINVDIVESKFKENPTTVIMMAKGRQIAENIYKHFEKK